MRKYIALAFAAISVMFVSCQKDFEPGGTEVEKMAGEWWVTATVIIDGQEAGDIELGHFRMNTYNTANNVPTEMWLDDDGNFWDYKLKVDVDYKNRTFSTKDFVSNVSYDCKVKVADGKVLEGVATTPSGMPADSIVYMIQFDDDEDALTYKVSGFRRTGFPADDF